MDSSLSIRVFSWRGDVHCTVDRVGRSDHRKYAPHTRLVSFTSEGWTDTNEADCFLWALTQLASLAIVQMASPPPGGVGIPSGDHRGGLPSPGVSATNGSEIATIKNATPTPIYLAAASAVSDGLQPPGWQPSLLDEI